MTRSSTVEGERTKESIVVLVLSLKLATNVPRTPFPGSSGRTPAGGPAVGFFAYSGASENVRSRCPRCPGGNRARSAATCFLLPESRRRFLPRQRRSTLRCDFTPAARARQEQPSRIRRHVIEASPLRRARRRSAPRPQRKIACVSNTTANVSANHSSG